MLVLGGCASLGEPLTDSVDPDDPRGQPGLISGEQGEFVIYRRENRDGAAN